MDNFRSIASITSLEHTIFAMILRIHEPTLMMAFFLDRF